MDPEHSTEQPEGAPLTIAHEKAGGAVAVREQAAWNRGPHDSLKPQPQKRMSLVGEGYFCSICKGSVCGSCLLSEALPLLGPAGAKGRCGDRWAARPGEG